MPDNYHQAKAELDHWKDDWNLYLDHQIDALDLGCIAFVDFLNFEDEHIKEAEGFGKALFKSAFYAALSLVPGAAMLGKSWQGLIENLSKRGQAWAPLMLETGFDFTKELLQQFRDPSGKTNQPVDSKSATLNSFIFHGLRAVYSKQETIIDIHQTADLFLACLKDRNVTGVDYLRIVESTIRDFPPPRERIEPALLYQAILYSLIKEWMSHHQVVVEMFASVSPHSVSELRPVWDDPETPRHEAVRGLNGKQLEFILGSFGSNSPLQQAALKDMDHELKLASKCIVSKAKKLWKTGNPAKGKLIHLVPKSCLERHVLLAKVPPIDKFQDLKYLGATLVVHYIGHVKRKDSPALRP